MNNWLTVCHIDEILPGTGVCALVNNEQVAIFRPDETTNIYALSNIDPFAQASVLSRGIIAEHQGDLWVASPLKKQHFRLTDGYCLEDDNYSVKVYSCQVLNNQVQIQIPVS